MDLRKIKFAKVGVSYLIESKQGIATCFRHYINLAQPSGFSDIDTSARPKEHIPLLYVSRKDMRGDELYEDDVIFIKLPDIYEIDNSIWKLCVVGYNEDAAAFGVYDLTPEFEQLKFVAFNQLSGCCALRLGNLHIDRQAIDELLDKIDKGGNIEELLKSL